MAVGDTVADHSLLHGSSEFRREIAHLIGVRQQHEIRLRAFDHLPQRDGIAVRRVLREQVVFDEKHFVELVAGKLVGERGDTLADDDARERAFGLCGDLLRGGERLKADFVPFRVALLGDEENFHCRFALWRWVPGLKLKRDSSLRSE